MCQRTSHTQDRYATDRRSAVLPREARITEPCQTFVRYKTGRERQSRMRGGWFVRHSSVAIRRQSGEKAIPLTCPPAPAAGSASGEGESCRVAVFHRRIFPCQVAAIVAPSGENDGNPALGIFPSGLRAVTSHKCTCPFSS